MPTSIVAYKTDSTMLRICNEDPLNPMAKSEVDIAGPLLEAATEVAKAVSADVVFAYANAVDDLEALKKAVKSPTRLVLACRDDHDKQRAKLVGAKTMSVPAFNLTRMGQIKMATLIAFTQEVLKAGDVFVFLTGVAGKGIDSLVTMRVGQEYELFQTVGQPKLTEHIRRPVFERVLKIMLELAHEGREGKSVGTMFVVGDHRHVQKYCHEGRINPFKGYTEKERNILDDSMSDVVKEIAKLDGAFVVKGTGVIVSACATVRTAGTGDPLPQGFGTRHAAAAAITACTKCIAITLSESTGDVRVWRRGEMITEIEKLSRSIIDGTAPSAG